MPPPPPPTGSPPPPVFVNKGYKKKVTSRTPSGTIDDSGKGLTLLDQLNKKHALKSTWVDLISGNNLSAKEAPEEKNHMSELFSKIKLRRKAQMGNATPVQPSPSSSSSSSSNAAVHNISSPPHSPKVEKKKTYMSDKCDVYQDICTKLSVTPDLKIKFRSAYQIFKNIDSDGLLSEYVDKAASQIGIVQKNTLKTAKTEDCFLKIDEYLSSEIESLFFDKADLTDVIKFMFACAVARKIFPKKGDKEHRVLLLEQASNHYSDHGIKHPFLENK